MDYGSGSMLEVAPGKWKVTVELPRDASGARRRLRFTVDGTRRDAQRALREAFGKRDGGLLVNADKVTVGEWLTAWLARHAAEGHIGAHAQDRYEGIVRKHLVPLLGRVRLQQLRPDHIADAKAKWLTGKGSTAARPLAGATVHKHLVVLREALADALKAGVIARNPLDAVTAPAVRRTRDRRALSEEEISQLLSAAAGTRYDAVLRLALATGMRESELLGARWRDLDTDAGTLAVARALVYVKSSTGFKEPKSANGRRTIELSASTLRVLRAHRTQQAETRLKLGASWQEHGLIFPSAIGTPWIPRAFYRGYRAVVERSGIVDPDTVDFHCLRHTAASQWIRHGVDIFTASRRLGHASAAFTMDVYSHLLKGQQRVAAEALDHLLAVPD